MLLQWCDFVTSPLQGSIFISMKPLDTFNEASGCFPAVFLVTKLDCPDNTRGQAVVMFVVTEPVKLKH